MYIVVCECCYCSMPLLLNGLFCLCFFVKDGMLIPGTVKSIHSRFGIFVELPSGLVGLAPNRVRFGERLCVFLGTQGFTLFYL